MKHSKAKRSNLEKSLLFKRFRKDLTDRYGEQKGSEIWRYAKKELQKMEMKEPNADKDFTAFVFPAVALYRAVEHYAPGDALEVTRCYGTKTGIRLKKIFRKVTAIPGIPTLIWKNMDKIAVKMSNDYEYENLIVTDHLCSLDVTGCPLYDKAKELGTPEAVQMICCMDKEYMHGFRGIQYKRTQSVAEGDECCDYRLTNAKLAEEKRKSPNVWNQSKKNSGNTAIVYYSKHHGNTKKLLDAIAAAYKVTLIDVTEHPDTDLSSYDQIGFASGIYYSGFAKQLLDFADTHLPENRDVFYIYTHGAPVGGFLKEIREIAKKKHCRELGAYHCLGYDTFGLFKYVGGISKGHPNKKEIAGAVEFYRKLN